MKTIIFATKNKGKLEEIKEKLCEYDIKGMEEIGVDVDIEEDGSTFEENAIKKAEEIMKICNDIVVADDSGLEIDYLNKAPGVLSARFLGHETSYEYKNNKILDMLKDVTDAKRSARFVCAMAIAMPGRKTEVIRETIEGQISKQVLGENGFGYDPIFYIPELDKTSAQLNMEEKNKISHRGKALEGVKQILDNID